MIINDLKQTCHRCNGRGSTAGVSNLGISQINYSGQCPECKGMGFFLTELGQDVVKLMRPFMEDIVREMLAQESREDNATGEETEEGDGDLPE